MLFCFVLGFFGIAWGVVWCGVVRCVISHHSILTIPYHTIPYHTIPQHTTSIESPSPRPAPLPTPKDHPAARGAERNGIRRARLGEWHALRSSTHKHTYIHIYDRGNMEDGRGMVDERMYERRGFALGRVVYVWYV